MKTISAPAGDFYASRHFPYYIVSPNFSQKSSGPRMLHCLCHMLNELGYEAYITAEINSPWLRTPRLTKEIVARHRQTDRLPIAVYPEVAKGNMLEAAVVARWILNQAGHLGGDETFSHDELLFYWDEWVLRGESADRLFLPSVDSRIFNSHGTRQEDRRGFCYYAHKYLAAGEKISPRIAADGISLCHDIPRTPEEIADILRRTQVLYCYEPSNIVAEAYACGCPAILVDSAYMRRFNMERLRIKRLPESAIDFSDIPVVSEKLQARIEHDEKQSRLSLENFISKTQRAAFAQAERRQTPAYRLQEGIDAFHGRELESAIETLAPLLDALPEDPLPPAYLAFICAAQGLVQEAEDFIGRARELAPERIDFLAALGESHLKAGNAEAALTCLQAAVAEQPDLLAAYPALARSLHLTGRSDEAVTLLTGAAVMPSAAQADIQSSLLEILVEQGDVGTFTRFCQRYSRGLADDLLATRNLARIDASGEELIDALVSAQTRLSEMLATAERRPATGIGAPPRRIAFLLGDFAREQRQGRLLALLRHLPAEDCETLLLVDDPLPPEDEHAQTCMLLADRTLNISGQDDALVLAQLDTLAPAVLVDLDGYGPASRLVLLALSGAPIKLLWGEAPLPALDPDWLPVQGECLADPAAAPGAGLILPGLGECLDLPALPLAPGARQDGPTRFACLTPAIRIGRETWALFAEVLRATPGSELTLNLHDLGEPARQFIAGQFTKAGIDAGRLRFIHARTPDALCRHWHEADIGLTPPVDTGETALPACLWMGKPFIALASALPWGQRPAALLAAAGAGEWLAATPEEYVALAGRTPPETNPSFREALRQSGLSDPTAFAAGFAAAIAALIEGRHA